MTQSPQMPELPAMPPAASVSPAPQAAAPSPTPRAAPVGTRRLRQFVGYVSGASIGFVLLVTTAQLALKPGLRPTDIAAMMESQTRLGEINQLMGHQPGEHVLTEAEYQETIAHAQREGQAKAELSFQKDLAVVQADKERVVGAYQTLYQRTNIIAQAGVQMEAQALQFRQALVQQTNGGRAVVIGVYDMVCALGDEDSCEKARQVRKGMMEESGSLTEGDVARKVNALMAGIPDPASFVASEDQRKNGAPSLPR